MVREGLGYAISIDKLISFDSNSELCFKPLYPELKSEIRLIWTKNHLFNSAAELFLREMQSQ